MAAITTMSVRFPDDQAQALKALAMAMDVSACAIVRAAMDDYIERCCTERVSQRRRGRAGERAWEVFDLLTRQARPRELRRYTL